MVGLASKDRIAAEIRVYVGGSYAVSQIMESELRANPDRINQLLFIRYRMALEIATNHDKEQPGA